MTATNHVRIELFFFDRDGDWSLERIRFQSRPGDEARETIRADRFGRVGPTFAWTKSMRALAILLLRSTVQTGEGVLLTGGRNSAALTLFNLLEHPERSAAATAFTDSLGVCQIRSMIQCANGGRAADGSTRRQIFLNRERLPPGSITIVSSNSPVTLPRQIDAILASLSSAWPTPLESQSMSESK